MNDLDVIVEYVGLPSDEEYMEGVRKKEKVYEEMGLKVAWIYPEDVWDESNGKYWKKENASEMVLNKIYEVAQRGSVKTDLYGFGRNYGNRIGTDSNRYVSTN